MAGKRPSPGGTKSQPRSLTPPSASNSTSVRFTISTSCSGGTSDRAEEVRRRDLAMKATAEICRELQRAAQRTVVDRRAHDLSLLVLREDRDAGQLDPAEGLGLPFKVGAQAVRRLVGEGERLVDIAGRCHHRCDLLGTDHRLCKHTGLENDVCRERVGEGGRRLLFERAGPTLPAHRGALGTVDGRQELAEDPGQGLRLLDVRPVAGAAYRRDGGLVEARRNGARDDLGGDEGIGFAAHDENGTLVMAVLCAERMTAVPHVGENADGGGLDAVAELTERFQPFVVEAGREIATQLAL